MKKILLILFLLLNECFAELSPIFEDNRIGYISNNGNIVIPCQYICSVKYETIRYGNTTILDYSIANWNEFDNGYVTLKHSDKDYLVWQEYSYSVVDSKNQIIFPQSEALIYGISDSMAVCQKFIKTMGKVYDSCFTYIDLRTNVMQEKQYRFAESFSNNFALVVENDKYFYINKNFQKAFDIDLSFASQPEITLAQPFSEHIAAIKIDSLWGFIDSGGKWIVKPQFHTANSFHNGLARVGKRAKSGKLYYGFTNRKGNVKDGFQYEIANDFSEGLANVRIGSKFIFIDTIQNQAIPEEYIYASPFSGGLAVVNQGSGFYFINKKGEIEIDQKFDYAKGFVNGLAKVWKNDELFYINKKGERVYTIIEQKEYGKLLKKMSR